MMAQVPKGEHRCHKEGWKSHSIPSAQRDHRPDPIPREEEKTSPLDGRRGKITLQKGRKEVGDYWVTLENVSLIN